MVPCSLIFLDIDGVLNWHQKLASGYCGIHCEKVALLNRILAAVPEAKIVVSSAWRYLILRGDMTLKGFEYLLLAHGVECHDRIHGHTVADGEIAAEPNHFDVEAWKVVGLKMRAEQIRRYMAGMPEGTPFVVIDDLPLVVDRLVQTDGLVGLTAEKADEVVAVLNTRNGVPPASVPQDDHDPRIDPRPGDNLEVVEKDDFENTSSAHHYRVLCVVEDHVGYKLYGAAWRGFMHLPAWQEKMKAATVMKVPEGNLQPKSSIPQETTEGVKRGD